MILKKSLPFEASLDLVKSGEDAEGQWIIEGFASTSDLDLQGDVIDPKALQNSESDLIDNSTVLFNHDGARGIGRVLDAKFQQPGQLWVKVLISKTAPDIWQQIKEGVLNKFSIRGKILDWTKRWSDVVQGLIRVVTKMALIEVSLVPLPANPKAKSLRWYVSKALNEANLGGKKVKNKRPNEDPEDDVTPNGLEYDLPSPYSSRDVSMSANFERMQSCVAKMASGQLPAEEVAEYATMLKQNMSYLTKDVNRAEKRLQELEIEKAAQEAEARRKATEAKMLEIAKSVTLELQEKVVSLEKALEETKALVGTSTSDLSNKVDTLLKNIDTLSKRKPSVEEEEAEGEEDEEKAFSDEEADDENPSAVGAQSAKSKKVQKSSDDIVGGTPTKLAKPDNGFEGSPTPEIDVKAPKDGITPVNTNKGAGNPQMESAPSPDVDTKAPADGITPVDTHKKEVGVSDDVGVDDEAKKSLPSKSKSLVKGSDEIARSTFNSFKGNSNWNSKDTNPSGGLEAVIVKSATHMFPGSKKQ